MPKLDLNACTSRNLTSVPGIDKHVADAIVKYRHKYKTFKHFDEIWKLSCMTRSAFQLLKKHAEVKGEVAPAIGKALPYAKVKYIFKLIRVLYHYDYERGGLVF